MIDSVPPGTLPDVTACVGSNPAGAAAVEQPTRSRRAGGRCAGDAAIGASAPTWPAAWGATRASTAIDGTAVAAAYLDEDLSMSHSVARLLSVVIPLLVWVFTSVSPVAAVETTSILLVVNECRAEQASASFLGGDFARRRASTSYTVAQLSRASIGGQTSARHSWLCSPKRRSLRRKPASFTSYVNGGGRLVAMRPDAQLNAVLGLGAGSTTLDNAYSRIRKPARPAEADCRR